MTTALLALSLAVVGSVGGHDPPSPTQDASNPQSALEIDGAVVGKLTSLRWRPTDTPVVNSQLSLTITHLEKRKTMFAVDRVPVASEFDLKFHYPDGAEYRVNVVAEVPVKRRFAPNNWWRLAVSSRRSPRKFPRCCFFCR